MRSHERTALAAALMLTPAIACAQFTGAVIFGDSLSDAGQYGSRFTTNPGLTAAEYVAQRFGFVVKPSFQGGTDFAQGGANVNSPSPDIPASAPNRSITQQVTQFLAAGPLDPNALYQIQGGGNDVGQLGAMALTGQISRDQLQGAVAQAASDLVAQAARLKAAGARYVVVYSVFNGGLVPDARAVGAGQQFTALVDLFNSTLYGGIRQLGLEVIPVNSFGLSSEVAANPAAFGLVNVTTPACTTPSSFNCTPSTLVAPDAPRTYLFADGRHQTTAFNELLAAAAIATIQAPQQIAMLGEAPLAVEKANFRAIDRRFVSSIGAPTASNKYNVWVTYDYSRPDMKSGFFDGNADVNTITVGVDGRVTPELTIGGAFEWSENKGDFGNGGYKLNEASGTLYAGYGMGPWYIGASIGVGDLDYKDIHRTIQLNALTRNETGNTHGTHMMYRLLGGYWLNYGNWLHGPIVKYTYQDIKIRAFQENGNDSTVLGFDQQTRKSSIISAGWQATGTLGNVRPYARVMWEYEDYNGDRTISATVPGMTRFTVPAYRVDRDWALFDFGAAMDFANRWTGFVTGSATAGKSDGDVWGITVGVRVPL